MKINILATFIILAVAGSAIAADAPAVQAKIVQINPGPNDVFTFRGPVTISYQLTIKNPLPDRTITLTRISLRTQSAGAYSLRADDPIKFTIDPDSSATVSLSAWGRSTGGFMRSEEPVNLVVQLYFDQQGGKSFTRQFVQYLPQL